MLEHRQRWSKTNILEHDRWRFKIKSCNHAAGTHDHCWKMFVLTPISCKILFAVYIICIFVSSKIFYPFRFILEYFLSLYGHVGLGWTNTWKNGTNTHTHIHTHTHTWIRLHAQKEILAATLFLHNNQGVGVFLADVHTKLSKYSISSDKVI